MTTARRPIVLLDAPSNLGLRPPAPGAIPGVYKLAGALRDQRLLERLGAREGGAAVPPRYQSQWEPGDGVRNEDAIERYSRRLADRVGDLVSRGLFPVVLGGDCSILLGHMLALRRAGRYGLVFIDGHSDFRHPGNAEFVGAAAGEDLALVTGRGDALANLENLRPLVRDEDVVVVGVQSGDGALAELSEAGIGAHTAEDVRRMGVPATSERVLAALPLTELDGFWIHCDIDVLDSALMPAVDTPEPGGLDFGQLADLLGRLLAHEGAVGLEITIFDPDLDESGELAQKLASCICAAFTKTRGVDAAPVDAFLAEAPVPSLADKLELFGQFVGSWDLAVTNHRPDGASHTVRAEWHFAWALGGRAIQDVWIAPSRAEREATDSSESVGEWGTTLRFYDETIDAWRSTWLGPNHGVVMPFVARLVDAEIVLEGSFEDGVLTRWIFSSITLDSFSWRAVDSRDGGKTWELLQEMEARRQSR